MPSVREASPNVSILIKEFPESRYGGLETFVISVMELVTWHLNFHGAQLTAVLK